MPMEVGGIPTRKRTSGSAGLANVEDCSLDRSKGSGGFRPPPNVQSAEDGPDGAVEEDGDVDVVVDAL